MHQIQKTIIKIGEFRSTIKKADKKCTAAAGDRYGTTRSIEYNGENVSIIKKDSFNI